jgi:hypothetical protein
MAQRHGAIIDPGRIEVRLPPVRVSFLPLLEVEKAAGTFSASMPRQAENIPAAFDWTLYLLHSHSLQKMASICRASCASFFRIIP